MARPKGLFATLRTWWRSKDGENGDEFGDTRTRSGTEGAAAAGQSAQGEAALELPAENETLALTARGDVFSFEVLPHFRWSSVVMTLEVLRERAGVHQELARAELVRRAWSVARGCDPSDPVAAEQAVNEELGNGWCYEDEKGSIRCVPSVRMRIDPVLREHILPFHLNELTLKEEHRLGLLKADHAESLTEQWLQVVRELEQAGDLGPSERRLMVPFAAALAEGGDFSRVMEALENTRRAGTKVLAQVLAEAAKNSEQVGLFEYANAYDKALGAFCRQMGLSPFSWVDGAVAADPGELVS
ncbi:hypothetical protein C8250_029110 [Streptomyces sp. So13.3]|uniref:hypothetical protein n=1 Tax=Streptomyces sp. So13.3 TaxID=2136173 RepID=UPI001106DD47|nr:hypothetical protein [Streptomyces sp. So13.3]QNA75410.1 hypothetical protein C8250_029110 [Streptomyces sp. So13.3]